ncbi:aldehyde dehydrogenase family protein [Nitrosospira sp. NRS527]|uniref:aldehyde dehydrogenase family protein n=1 Tax=Nitrosospira sp. NRS527 TaxID=155925 RepID=UPI001AFB19BA|nr:aldehyde dehydrogenase family protein [Nitrosospira sp. NRS527]BCT66516.1 3-succinoylsemialdehyde-pyridine dehydrogenase [Nitrosospira sp. NRS527]
MKQLNQIYINGEFVTPHGTRTLDLLSPVTNEKVAQVTLGDEVDTQNAIVAAKKAFKTFSQTSKEERIGYLEKMHEILKRRRQNLIDVMIDEYGCPLYFTTSLIDLAVDDFKIMAQLLKDFDLEPKVGHSRVRLQGVGVVGVIIPWNSSNGFIATKVSAAIAAGCTCVIKPSEFSAQQTQLMTECFHEAGLPRGVVNFVNGTGDVVGAEMTRNPGITKITFTGSTGVGKIIAKGAVESMKRVTLELGGKSPNIILEDADFATAIPQAILAAYINSGQACVAATRLLVPENRLSEVNELAKAAIAGTVKVGNPKDADTIIGPMVNQKQFERVQDYIRIGIEEGAALLTGGTGKPTGLEAGNFVKATIFTNVKNSMRIAQEEIFGPVLSIIPYKDEADAIAIANDSPYGLAAYITAGDKARAYRIANQLDAGRVCINGEFHDPLAPFGGFKQSGYGREFGVFGLETYLEPKAIIG